MRKKKLAAAMALAAALCALPSPLASQAGGADPASADVAVLLDLSQSVMPYIQDVTDYVVSSVVRDYLRSGDSFHLLSFGESAQVEIAQRMASESDVKSVLGRLYLLYPLARYTDFAGALGYLYQYLSDLPSGRPKVVVVITDGVHNPPSTSPTYGLPDEKVAAEIESSASRIRANGWPVHIIKLPFAQSAGAAASAQARDAEGRSFLDAAAKALGAPVSEFQSEGKEGLAVKTLGIPTAEFPGDLGKRDYAFSFPLRVTNGSEAPVGLELARALVNGEDVLERRAFLNLPGGKSGTMKVPVVLPDSIPEGEQRVRIELSFANGVRVSPREGTLTLTLARSPLGALFRSGARVALFIVILALGLAAVVALVLILRGAGKRAQAPVVAAVLGAESGADSRLRAEDASLLRGAAARSDADRRERESAAEDSAAAMAEARRAEAIRDAELLAAAAGGRESAQPARKAPGKAAAAAGASAQERDRGEYEASVEEAARAIAAERKAEAERSAALLAAALPRHAPPAVQADQRVRAGAYAYESRVAKPGSTRIELKVEDQNPHIGLRNVHSVRAGSSKSVGGGASDFLVFLVRVPRRVADLHFDGEKLTFVPRRPELFPDLAGPVEDCLGKDIPMLSGSGYPLRLRFEAYEEPAKSINRLLHCIDVPGLI